ncbi:hypothetical protein BXP70_27160 [Hymenobacter crusticola]|uniref:HTH cro/C1-type domain-containing protein n=2 Tax=Hymenobacter crusticola TaxID=1770526 RepID=A0A243W655_9BACT|nr:hypothetical protein BXP70_27160 [Hymenobacter crusticola]
MQAQGSSLGNNIKAFRTNMELSQQQLADFLGVKREMVSYFENGTRKPSILLLEKLANLFGINLADLLSNNPQEQQLAAAFAFRASGELGAPQLEQVADFRRIVTNYLKMQELLKREQE